MSNLSNFGTGTTMVGFADLRLKTDVLARYALPDLLYPVPADELEEVAGCKDDPPLSVLLYGLQQSAGDGKSHWKELEAAMRRLAELLAPADDRTVAIANGDNWWLEIGPVDLTQKIVTVQRGNDLVAAMTPREDGRLRVSVYRPLDAKTAEYLIALSLVPDPAHGVAMRENNWEYALDGSAANGNFYAADRGEAYLSYWEKGIGFSSDGTEFPEWRSQSNLVPQRPAVVAAELGVHHTLSAEALDRVEPDAFRTDPATSDGDQPKCDL